MKLEHVVEVKEGFEGHLMPLDVSIMETHDVCTVLWVIALDSFHHER